MNDWHVVHLGSRAAGGAGLVLTEATAVDPRGRISPSDLGIWDDQHVPGLQRVASFVRAQGANHITVAAVHPVLSGGAMDRLRKAPIDDFVFTDSIPIQPHK